MANQNAEPDTQPQDNPTPDTESVPPLPPPPTTLPAKRPQRPQQDETQAYTQTASGRLTVFPFALGLIGLGALLLLEPFVEGFRVTWGMAIIILAASLLLTYLFRFFASGRRERGLFFLASVGVGVGGTLGGFILVDDDLPIQDWWPLFLLGMALALVVTFWADPNHERGLLPLAGVLLVAMGVALAVTLGVVPQGLLDTTSDYFPLMLAFVGITLIPLALRQSSTE